MKVRGKKIGAVALARKLAGVLWAMWRDGTVYDPGFQAQQSTKGLKVDAQDSTLRARAMARTVKKFERRERKLTTRTRRAKTSKENPM